MNGEEKEFKIPEEVMIIITELMRRGFGAHIVGGPARDMIIGREPKDWDVTTSARPDDIQVIFPDSFYENDFGTVGVKTGSDKPNLQIVEVTTFRKEGRYSDLRHPDEVVFTDSVEEDLSRRDFTMNAVAISAVGEVMDPYNGAADIAAKLIRTVGEPEKRFEEDALRLLRAVRFAVELGFEIEAGTAAAIRDKAHLIEAISKERVRDEFAKIVMAEATSPSWGIVSLENMGLLKYVLPELREGINVGQNKHHIYTVWEHNLRVLDYAAKNKASLEVRLAALFHDIGKPKTKAGDGPDSTFYNHEVVGSRMAYQILERLKFPKEVSKRVAHLIRHHMFYYNVGEVTEAGVRRFIRRAGEDAIDDLMLLREADRIGSGVPKAVPYKMRHLKFMIDKVRRDPISPKMLKINGGDLMKLLEIGPGPRVGFILNALLEEVIDDPSKNTDAYLNSRAAALNAFSDNELAALFESAKGRKEDFEARAEREMKRQHKV